MSALPIFGNGSFTDKDGRLTFAASVFLRELWQRTGGLTGLRISAGTDTVHDLIVNAAASGLVLKDTQGTPHYWRVTVNNAGALVITDIGTTKP